MKNAEKTLPKVMKDVDKHGITVDTISIKKPTLDDVFLHYTGRSIREEKADKKMMMRMMRKRRMGR